MPVARLAHADIHYELYGPPDGFPVLLLAPGGLRSREGLWRHTHDGLPRPWPDPTVELAHRFRVIVLDQRNAGRSSGAVLPTDGWDSYADDHLGVLDALGVDRVHVMGACIGASFALKLIERAPRRVVSAVLQAPIGWTPENAPLRGESFQAWEDDAGERLAGVSRATLDAFAHNLFGGRDFVYSVGREFVRALDTPLLVLAGNDVHHPTVISEEIVRLAPHARLVREWKGSARRAPLLAEIDRFLDAALSPAVGFS